MSKTGEEVDKEMSFPIAQAERSGNNLKFIMSLFGKVDNDALVFELLIKGDSLKGHLHEFRKGSNNLSITFIKESEAKDETI